eukprot:684511-Rhodomonas_salina.6
MIADSHAHLPTTVPSTHEPGQDGVVGAGVGGGAVGSRIKGTGERRRMRETGVVSGQIMRGV